MSGALDGGARPFDDVRVLDITTTPAGAIASMYIADFGGDVVRVDTTSEDRLSGDPLRLFADRNKRVTSLALTSAGGLKELRRLVHRADVIVIDSPAWLLDRYGLDAITLCTSNSQLVHVWMPAHAARGRGSSLPADDLLLAAATRVADQQPATVDRPVAPVVPHLTYEHGALGAIAIAAGLLGRQRTGLGRAVTVSGLHAAGALNASFLGHLPGTVRAFGGPKANIVGAPSSRMYQCGDGKWLMLACMTRAFFDKALEAMGMRHVMQLPGIDGDMRNLRDPRRQPLVAEPLEARMRDMDRSDWLLIFDRAGVPNAPIEEREEWLGSETVAANQVVVTVDHSELGPVRLPGILVELSATPGRVERLVDRRAMVGVTDVWANWPPYPRRGAGQSDPDATLPLAGLRVLDLGQFLAGPFVSDILGDFGATVVKVEHPAGDGYRMSPISYAAMNKGKRNLSIDLKEKWAIDVLLRLAREADVLVDNARAGVPERLGIHYEALRAVNPGLVRCTVTAWGEGPLKETPCFDHLLQARSGLMAAQGGHGDPVLLAMPPHDVGAATLGAFGTLAALIARPAVGAGQEVKTSLTHASIMQQAAEVTTFAGSPTPARGGQDYLGPSPSRRLYRCLDGWIAVSAETQPEKALRRALALPPGPKDDFEQWFANVSVEEALDDLAAASIPAAKVLGRDDVFEDPWLAENGFFASVRDTEHGQIRVVRGYADWGRAATAERAWSHSRGQDTAEILRESGFTEDSLSHRA